MKRFNLIAVLVGFLVVVIFAGKASAMYDPDLGRFLQRDPGPVTEVRPSPQIMAQGRIFQRDPYVDGMNLYQYARSNPMYFTDPSGLQVKVYLSTGNDWKERDDFAAKVKDAFQTVIGKCGTVDFDTVNEGTSKLAVYKITEDKSKTEECKCEKCFSFLKEAIESKGQDVYIDMNKKNEANTIIVKGGAGSLTTIDPNLNQEYYETDPEGGDDIATPMRFDVALWHEAIGHGIRLNRHNRGDVDVFTRDFENDVVRKCLRDNGVDIRDRILDYSKAGPIVNKK